MNKKGFTMLYALMMGVLCFILGLALAPALSDTTASVMSGSQLNCANATISNQDKAVCTQVDLYLPLFTALLFGIAGFIIAGIGL